jgi:hypothetical protein
MGQKDPGFYQIKGGATLRWRRNSKGEYTQLRLLRNEIEANFTIGDLLYGRWEARVPWRNETGLKGGEIGSKIGDYEYNIIDDLNNAIMSGVVNDKEVANFAEFLENLAKQKQKLLHKLSDEYGACVSAD